MEKNWLIRTQDNHLLGPVTLLKVKELLENGSLKEDDELCQGNGFWFFIREETYLQAYVHEYRKQEFNPVSEAQTVLANAEAIEKEKEEGTDEFVIESFERDEVEQETESEGSKESSESSEEVTQFIQLPTSQEIREDSKALEEEVQAKREEKRSIHARSKRPVIKPLKSSSGNIKRKKMGDKILIPLAIIFFILMIIAFYYRNVLIQKFLDN